MHFYYEKPDLVARNWDGGLINPLRLKHTGSWKFSRGSAPPSPSINSHPVYTFSSLGFKCVHKAGHAYGHCFVGF